MSYNKAGLSKPKPEVMRCYELACGHVFTNLQILPVGEQVICRPGGAGTHAGAHMTSIVRKLRNAK